MQAPCVQLAASCGRAPAFLLVAIRRLRRFCQRLSGRSRRAALRRAAGRASDPRPVSQPRRRSRLKATSGSRHACLIVKTTIFCNVGHAAGERIGDMESRLYFFLKKRTLARLFDHLVSRGFAWFFAHSRPHGICSGQHVVATFYASGQRTASGQRFVSSGYAAAHRTLPFGSRVTVTNPQNGRSVTVVINDRGPFTRGLRLT